MSNPKEKSDRELIPDLGTDREQTFSNSFPDPAFDEMLPDLSLDSAPNGPELSLVHETAAAVQELVLDASGSQEADLATLFPHGAEGEIEPGLNLASEANQVFAIEERSESALLIARAEMADRLFDLIASEKSFSDLLENILLSLQQALGAQAGSVLEFDKKKNEFFFRASVGGGEPQKVKAFRVPAMKGIVGHVAETRQPILIKNLENDELQLLAVSMSTGFDAKTCVAAPIIIENQLYGVIELFNKLTTDEFDEKDLHLLEEGARMAAKILEVRFLLAELARRAR